MGKTKYKQTYHKCPYCGAKAEGDYEMLLCEDCRMTFGHSLFTEL